MTSSFVTHYLNSEIISATMCWRRAGSKIRASSFV